MSTTLASINDWFKVAKPNPTIDDARVQIGCHYEEVAEMMAALMDNSAVYYVTDLSYKYKTLNNPLIQLNSEKRREELLDALADQIVTAIGVAHMLGMDITGALAEVNRSNWSKFVDGKPVFNEHGKIIKGEGYTPPDLTPFI